MVRKPGGLANVTVRQSTADSGARCDPHCRDGLDDTGGHGFSPMGATTAWRIG
jgi:hypothetical protein